MSLKVKLTGGKLRPTDVELFEDGGMLFVNTGESLGIELRMVEDYLSMNFVDTDKEPDEPRS